MGSRNKIVRQQSWLQAKAAKGRQRIQERRDRRREEDKNPARRAERLAKNKPLTLDDKRVFPVSEDYYARRKRRRVEAEKAEEEADGGETADAAMDGEADQADQADAATEKKKGGGSDEEDGDEGEDSDIASLLAGDSDEEEEDEDDDDDTKKGAAKQTPKGAAKTPKDAASQKDKAGDETEEEAAARAAHEDAMAAKYAALLPPVDDEAAAAAPRLLITTSRHATIHRYAHTLADLFPNSTYIPRSGHRFVQHEYSLREIAGFAHNRGYAALLVLNEDQKKPTGLDIALLPQGPMLHFSIQTWVDAKRLPNHGRSTGHVPEVILNNFVTPLGRLVGGVLGRLFPRQPELVGRQVVTLHNQRDYVFVRRHRYAVRDKRATERSVADRDGRAMAGVEDVRVALQEIGPRMTLKLRRVDRGLQRMSGQAFEWTGRMEKKRTVWQL